MTGQDAEQESVQYIIDGKQSMTVFKDVRTLAKDAIAAAEAYLKGEIPDRTTTYNNGKIDVPAKPSTVVTVTIDNVRQALMIPVTIRPAISLDCRRRPQPKGQSL